MGSCDGGLEQDVQQLAWIGLANGGKTRTMEQLEQNTKGGLLVSSLAALGHSAGTWLNGTFQLSGLEEGETLDRPLG